MTSARDEPRDAPLAQVVLADQRLEQARTDLREAVDRARAAGRTWAELGDALGISRQAAFKRFGSPRDPRTGEHMTRTSTAADVGTLTERVFTLLDAGDYDRLRALMTDETAAVLTRDLVLDTWARAIADTGNLVACLDTGAELPDGSPVADGEPVLGSVIGHTVLACEAGRWVGRVAIDPDHHVVGLLVVPPDHRDLPF